MGKNDKKFENTAAGQMVISGSLRSRSDCRTGNWSRRERPVSSRLKWDTGIAPLTLEAILR
ncbi:3-methyl-2-oxobutanoate hydroxymethyltransferase [Clarias magur]|uniref:3-methyl-2-oxobutanoate hydroxymethyltransferase n=1 Tax=Clarias magur TaxID=1594786 RepID=A0A8J4WXK6_CLAMG|nr:3-methyl-2-oxobutanoate hydroxymethyltransferase [Clarias magur]